MLKPKFDLTGQQFGKWTVLKFVGRPSEHQYYRNLWQCRCACGQIASVGGENLLHGRSKGCSRCRLASFLAAKRPRPRRYLPKEMKIYLIWRRHKRCNLLCREWQDFQAFRKAVGWLKPKECLMRFDTTKLFTPDNFYIHRPRKVTRDDRRRLRCLSGLEKQEMIVKLRHDGFTLEQIGNALGISREGVRQLIDPAKIEKKIAFRTARIEFCKRRVAGEVRPKDGRTASKQAERWNRTIARLKVELEALRRLLEAVHSPPPSSNASRSNGLSR